ncbi:MAG: RluA family pseudouridine synthase [Myxococcales bacterium]
MSLVWIAGPDDGATVGALLQRAGVDLAAVHEGRVFVGRKRARSEADAIHAGETLRVASHVESPPVTLLARASDLVVINKPAGIATIADHLGRHHAAQALTARLLGLDEARLHATSRLDRDVSGAVTFALTKDARDRLALARTEGTYVRRYVALVERAPAASFGTWNVPIGRARDPKLRAPDGEQATTATTHFRVVDSALSFALLALEPVTGRTHQLRVHAAHAGCPMVGDRDYGARTRVVLPSGRVLAPDRVALHCACVGVPLADGSRLEVKAPIPEVLTSLWMALGGEPSAWDRALQCSLDRL